MLQIRTWRDPIPKSDTKLFSKTTVEKFHLEREGNGVKVVSDGFVDNQKLIDSEAKNAGLQNILKLQELRYGTIENAIKRNEDKQVFADVSKIPLSVAEQKEYLAKVDAAVKALCEKLNISRDELSNLTEFKFEELKQKAEGGNE